MLVNIKVVKGSKQHKLHWRQLIAEESKYMIFTTLNQTFQT